MTWIIIGAIIAAFVLLVVLPVAYLAFFRAKAGDKKHPKKVRSEDTHEEKHVDKKKGTHAAPSHTRVGVRPVFLVIVLLTAAGAAIWWFFFEKGHEQHGLWVGWIIPLALMVGVPLLAWKFTQGGGHGHGDDHHGGGLKEGLIVTAFALVAIAAGWYVLTNIGPWIERTLLGVDTRGNVVATAPAVQTHFSAASIPDDGLGPGLSCQGFETILKASVEPGGRVPVQDLPGTVAIGGQGENYDAFTFCLREAPETCSTGLNGVSVRGREFIAVNRTDANLPFSCAYIPVTQVQ